MNEEKDEYKKEVGRKIHETDQKLKQTTKTKNALEAEVRALTEALLKEKHENYENTMTINKGAQFNELGTNRYERDKKHIEDL